MPSARKRRMRTASFPIPPTASRSPQTSAPTACSSTGSTRGALAPIDTLSTHPPGWTGTSYRADLHVAANGRTLYVSNRGHNSSAVFSVAEATGALALEQVVATEGDWPRNFSLDPGGRWLLVANQRSDSIIVFARDRETGRLTLTSQRIA